MSLKYEMYRDGKEVVVVGQVACRACLRTIEPMNPALYIESWHKDYGFREALVCGSACAEKQDDLRFGKFYEYPVLIVTARPEGSMRKMPEAPEYAGPIDWTEANSWAGKLGGEVRYSGRYARDPDVMNMHGEKPLIPAKDADGIAIADFSDANKTRSIDVSEEKTASDLDLIFSAKPIDAHSQVESDDKMRLEDDR